MFTVLFSRIAALPSRCRPVSFLLSVLLLLSACPVLAQEAAAEPAAQDAPFAVVNVAGVERWLENIEYVFKSVDRPEMTRVATGSLSRVNDLKGIDRARPFGVMLYLDAAFSVAAVGYLPMQAIDDLTKTLAIGPVTVQPIDAAAGRFELVGGRRKLWLQTQGAYAFVADRESALERKFPDPVELTKNVAERYDLSAIVNLEKIPETTRQVLLALLRNNAQAQLQQRDNESDLQYRIRRANGVSNLEFLELVLTHAQRLTLGWDVSPQNRRAVLELSIEARPESPLAHAIQKVGSRPSHFRGLMNEAAPLGLSISWQMAKGQKDATIELLKAAQQGVAKREGDGENSVAPADSAASGFFSPLIATAEQGHVDFFAQMSPNDEGKMVLAGGLKVLNAEALAAGMETWLRSLQGSADFAEVQVRADSHRGIDLHRLVGSRIRREDERIYGEKPALTIGAGEQVLWFAVGGKDSAAALKGIVDGVANRTETEAPAAGDPLRIAINMNRWRGLGPEPRAGRPQPGLELFREAFDEQNDTLSIDIRPTENGGRLRLEFGEGFLRMLGLGIARRFDQLQL